MVRAEAPIAEVSSRVDEAADIVALPKFAARTPALELVDRARERYALTAQLAGAVEL
jgi:hypothetical protein